MNLFIFFVFLSIVNVIGGTIKSLLTINGNKWVASIANAIYFGFYTIVLIYMNCDLTLWQKVSITAICNFIGVFVVKYFEEKTEKEKLWKVEATLPKELFIADKEVFDTIKVPHNYIDIEKYVIMNFYCANKKESDIVKNFMTLSGAQYFVSESKIL